MAERLHTDRTATPQRRKATGTASRFVATGAAVGAGLVLVGAMSAAADAGASSKSSVEGTPSSVFPPDASNPAQIVVVVPGLEPSMATVPQASVVLPASAVVPPRPAEPAAPIATSQAPAPVAESGGS